MSERIIDTECGLIIEDLRKEDPKRWLYILTADLNDPSINEHVKDKLLLKTARRFHHDDIIREIIEHVRNVSSILTNKGGNISNIKTL